jgi:hypothetical protein
MGRLYANENFPYPVVEELRYLGHDVLTIQETGKAGQALSDESVLTFAAMERRALLTFNRKHFIYLHQRYPNHAGLFVCTFNPDFAALARQIHTAIEGDEPLTGKLIRINRPGP